MGSCSYLYPLNRTWIFQSEAPYRNSVAFPTMDGIIVDKGLDEESGWGNSDRRIFQGEKGQQKIDGVIDTITIKKKS